MNTLVSVLLCLLLALVLLALLLLFCPVFLRLEYKGTLKATLFVLGVPLDVAWLLSKRKGRDKDEEAPAKKARTKKDKPSLWQTAQDLYSFLSAILRAVRAAAAELKRHLHVRIRHLTIRIGTRDAAQTALLYGQVQALLASLLGVCEEHCHLSCRHDRLSVDADFQSESSDAAFGITFFLLPVFLLTGALKAYAAYMEEILALGNPNRNK